MSQVIQLDGSLSDVQDDQIEVYASNTPSELSDQFDRAIDSQLLIGEPTLSFIIYANEIVNVESFGTSQLNQTIFAQSLESTVQFGDSQPQLSVVLNSVENTSVFGTSQLNFKLFAETLDSEVDFGSPQLNRSLTTNSVESVAIVANPKINMQIDDVPFPSIESTLVIPNPKLVATIRPLSINTTVNFGTAVFVDNIHRLLVFKDDNISKVGNNDAVVIAGGIRMNPSSLKVAETELPANPVGFLSINIDGRDYKLPYYE
jgi:hypothetical protein